MFTILSETQTVAPDESTVVDVQFTPNTFLAFEDILRITSNDQESPEIDVPLSGTGIDEPLPDIHFDALHVDFGTVSIGQTGTQYINLQNVGRANLNLGELSQTGSGAFHLAIDPSGQTIAGENSLPLILGYTPTQSAGDNGTLVIPSNDPDEPEVTLTLIGNGGGSFEYPQAVIDCPSTSEPPAWVALDGSASNDPAGNEPLTFKWSVIDKPSYSQGELSDTVTETTNLFTDVAGDYVVQLIVTNEYWTTVRPREMPHSSHPSR